MRTLYRECCESLKGEAERQDIQRRARYRALSDYRAEGCCNNAGQYPVGSLERVAYHEAAFEIEANGELNR